MMRTIEVLLVIIIITGAFIIASLFAVLPSPRQVSPINLRRLALTTLQMLDVNHDLSDTVFKNQNDTAWAQLQIALSACLPPNIVYNLTVYEAINSQTQLYYPIKSLSNAESLGISTDSSSYLVASSNVTFNVITEKIGEHGNGGTLYILNCSDANGWWITGYTAQKLASDLYNMLSPYFQSVVMVQNTTQFATILNGTSLQGETLRNAVIINTFGETVPIPAGYYSSPGVGYDSDAGHSNHYAQYCYTLGQKVNLHNWTWVSIVGWPLYYVSNTDSFKDNQNDWGIYGMVQVNNNGLQAFLQGIDSQSYAYSSSQTWDIGVVNLSSNALYYCNYYGIYPAPYQTSTRALSLVAMNSFNLYVTTYVFDRVGDRVPGAIYRHKPGGVNVTGSFFALGLTRIPDIRLTALGLLCDYKPRLYASEYTANCTSRMVLLQLGQVGGV